MLNGRLPTPRTRHDAGADPARSGGLPQRFAGRRALRLVHEADEVLADQLGRIMAEQRGQVVVHEHDLARRCPAPPGLGACPRRRRDVHIYEVTCEPTGSWTRLNNRGQSLPASEVPGNQPRTENGEGWERRATEYRNRTGREALNG